MIKLLDWKNFNSPDIFGASVMVGNFGYYWIGREKPTEDYLVYYHCLNTITHLLGQSHNFIIAKLIAQHHWEEHLTPFLK